MVSWRLARGSYVLTCCIDVEGEGHEFEVMLLPHWDFGRAVIERFQAASAALERHAQLTSILRMDGWRVVGYTS